jgi:WD40 repeat protein/basic membrane lipoprotein Med (substrate-binding protein (PBP1-ABC) superfamily)/transcriptional regulator with XRE-family HTH domain
LSASIPVATLEKFTTFGDLLRYLRRAAGLTQMELSIQVGYSHAQISRLEQNLRLPDLPTVEARFVPALGLQNEPKAVGRLLDLAANVRREDAPGPGLCPYKGLNYFDESDAELFVGREALTAKLTERILSSTLNDSSHEPRFLAVIGASGSGKSSLVRAGVVPALRWDPRSADWQIQVLTPTAHPLATLAATLTSESESVTATSTLIDDLARDPRSLQLFIRRHFPLDNQSRILLVIDQFEELFTLCRSEDERAAFIGNLLTAAWEMDGRAVVIITLRADFYAHCASYEPLREALAQNQVYIGAMTEDELRRAIEEPARRGRWEFEPGLVNLLLQEVGHEPGTLPLLSHAMLETWQRRRGRVMTLGGYTSSGGVRGAIAETAETVFTDQFTSEQRSIARRIFLRLTEINDEMSAADTRRRAGYSELILKPEDAEATHAVLNILANARLIIASQDSAEVAHEALIREWPTLRGWLEENREGLRLHRQLTEVSQEWLRMERLADVLYRGALLVQLQEWASKHGDELNELEHEFLNASTDLTERELRERETLRLRELDAAHKLADSERQRAEEQKQTANQLRRRSIYLAAAFVLALIMALTTAFFGRQAQAASRIASSRELAAASISNLDIDPQRSILLALEALSNRYTVQAEEALHRAIERSHVQHVFQVYDPGTALSIAFSPNGKRLAVAGDDEAVRVLEVATGRVLLTLDGHAARYSPDGKSILTAAIDGTLKAWDASTGKEIRLPGQMDAGRSIAFRPDGEQIATVVSGDVPKIWDVKTGRELVAFPGHTDFVGSVSFSPDAKRLITASDDGTARVWEAGTGKQILSLSGQAGWVWNAVFRPDGRQIATASGSEAYLWEANTGRKLFTLIGHTSDVYALAFSPDSTRLATGGADRKIILWDVSTGKELFSLPGHTGSVYDLAFSPDGQSLASSSDDGSVRIWDLMPDHELFTISTPRGSDGQIAYAGDGTRLASSDESAAVQIWDAHTGKELMSLSRSKGRAKRIIFSPVGAYMFTSGDDGQVWVWDLETGREVTAISAHTGTVNSMAITQDGTRLATAGSDYKVKLWNISSGQAIDAPLFTFDQPGIVFAVAFSADGAKLGAGLQDGTTSIWALSTGKETLVLRGHRDAVTAVAFDPGRNRILTASLDGTARVWDADSGRELFTLRGHIGPVTSVAYSPDGSRLATASRDGTVKLWDAASGNEILTFFGDGSGLNHIAFSPDGTRLATGSDRGVQVYLLQVKDLIALAHTRVTRSLTSDECQKYLHLKETKCATTATVPTATAMPPSVTGRLCQVTNTAGLYDHSFNEITFKGLQDVTAQFKWDARVLQSASMQDFDRNIQEFLRSDCDLIVGLLPMTDTVRAAAQNNPKQKFLISDFVYDAPLQNVWTQVYATDQAAFLAGYAASSVTKTGKVATFGAIDIPSVTDFMDGFALGVAYYNAKNGNNVEVLGWDPQKHEGLFVGGFCCALEGRQMTQQLLEKGADVILPVAGTSVGSGVVNAVQANQNAYVIGVDTDWALAMPEYEGIFLTSILKKYDVSVVQVSKTIVDDQFSGGVHLGTLETGEVGLAPFYKLDVLFSPKVKMDLAQLREDIVTGKIKTKP